ncbi:MAG: hypothetical protein NC231_09820 [Bacillus sp. (in: Bacteria)]|nr:hypothetical protein [Bacillus sp. (in: firmicutes)]MCM1427038.1 hypothetical protein [Eubacterium sp.]
MKVSGVKAGVYQGLCWFVFLISRGMLKAKLEKINVKKEMVYVYIKL